MLCATIENGANGMGERWYTAMCNERGCYWQGSTTDINEALRWRYDHAHGTLGVDIIPEDTEDE